MINIVLHIDAKSKIHNPLNTIKWTHLNCSEIKFKKLPMLHENKMAKTNSIVFEKSPTNCFAFEWNRMNLLNCCLISHSFFPILAFRLRVLKLHRMSLVIEISVKHGPIAISIMHKTKNSRLNVNKYWTMTAIKYPNRFFVSNGNLKFEIEIRQKHKTIDFSDLYLLTTWEVATQVHQFPSLLWNMQSN